MLPKNLNSFFRSLKNKGFNGKMIIKIGWYDILKPAISGCNKSLTEMPKGDYGTACLL
jgi:hypothetical protein